ncbi:glycoside hydrolase family 43 protein [Algibacillus agarilyticus]|uniref:glycoside hydrolase family 43 protein n=1 Tax=Algibacillus agarilyticus TaxID=2234133 RepID=UPI000DD01501|nr:glycoside hydrolase family 43 protein [Algibacillus agarilyticus]
MTMIINPILPGFNPDPSICRVGDDYYIATSTFEWFPGVQIHHSRDLVNWRLLDRVLTTRQQLDLRGAENSSGCWAPALTYSDGLFWLAFANTKACRGGSWMSTPCWVVTAETIEGPWSDPISIGAIGFDPSIFHDDDGKKYILNLQWDGRLNRNYFGGIVIQEFDPVLKEPVGDIKPIFNGTEYGGTEGPQMLKKDGYYYLVTAEGGTGFSHAVTVCRSKNIMGPYEVHPTNPIITSRYKGDAPLQRTGHGFFVETQTGEWYMTHLCGRPVLDPEGYNHGETWGRGFSILGRETAIQKVLWHDDWPYLANGTTTGDIEVEAPDLVPHPWPIDILCDDFANDNVNKHFQTLRDPIAEHWCSLKARPGFLRLRGQHYLYSNFEQSMLARRVQAMSFCAETELEFEPNMIQEMAGLIVYYDKGNHYFLNVTINDKEEKILQIVQYTNNVYAESAEKVLLPRNEAVKLKVELKDVYYQFSWSINDNTWHAIGPKLNAVCLSDEFGGDIFRFTGSFVGLFAADITGRMKEADFAYFNYIEQ